MTGAQIIADRWQIMGVLGEGGMGDVFRGQDLETGDPVAIKLLKPDIVDTMPHLIERFKREAALLHQLDHPYIVKIFGAVEEDDQHYLIMEFVPGGTLRDLMRADRALSVERTLELALDITDALTRAHRLHIVHRDLKPENVLIAEDGSPRLSDFGIARMGDSTTITQSGALVGTLGYISPEACQGQPLDPRSDIWSFGVMLVEMLTGENPFDRGLVAATITAILTDPLPDLETLRPDIPVALVDLLYRMLEKDPDYRISSMRLVGAELEALLRGEPVTPASGGSRRRLSSATPDRMNGPVRAIFKHDWGAQTTPFVGRAADLQALDRLVRDPDIRLVTIAAPGGMGKTRLAMEYAARQFGTFPAGVYFIPLAGLSRSEDIVQAIAESVHFIFAGSGDKQAQILAFLSNPEEQEMLLVLDNFEHVLDSAPLVSAILRAAPAIQILTTSRERLNLSDEVVFELGGMEIPEGLAVEEALQHETVQLFAQSARRIQPNFELTRAQVLHVLRICRSVFGNPLGIVLAAAWIEMLSVEEIAHEVEISLDFLQTDARDVPERQRSLRAVFESSWNMLSETERDVFMKLSIFQGGVKRTVAQYITRASLQTLAALVKKSLLRRDADSGRYEVHELLRQYAAEELERSEQAATTHDIHCHYFVSLVARQAGDLRGGGQVDGVPQANAIREIDADIENVRSAWAWAVARKNAPMAALALDGLFLFCWLVGEFDELADLLRSARHQFAPRSGDPPSELWRRVAVRCELVQTPHNDRDQIEMLIGLAREAGEPAHSRVEEAFGLWALAYWHCAQGQFAEAVPLLLNAAALFEEAGDVFMHGRTLSDAGIFSAVTGAHAESVGMLYRAAETLQATGDAAGADQARSRMALNMDYLIAAGLVER